MEQRMLDISSDLIEIKADVKTLVNSFNDGDFERRIARLESASNLWRWLSPTLSAAFASAVTFLVIEYLKK